jgi:hypothetical protein
MDLKFKKAVTSGCVALIPMLVNRDHDDVSPNDDKMQTKEAHKDARSKITLLML